MSHGTSTGVLGALIIGLSSLAAAQNPAPWSAALGDCLASANGEARARGCNAVIEAGVDSPADLAHAHLNRAGVRVVTAPDGRSLTVRYFRRGAITGVASLFTPTFTMLGSIQALRDSELLVFDPKVVRRLADRDITVARGLLDELSERVVNFVAEIPGSAFATVRQRVARHLLDMASEQQHGEELIAHVSQQALADAAGSVREVVVRVLRDLREEGVIVTARTGITILRPDDLVIELFPVSAQWTD